MAIKTLSAGFIATKDSQIVKIQSEVYDIGFYLKTTIDGKLQNMTTRNSLKKAQNFIDREKTVYQKKGFEIKDLGLHKVRLKDTYFNKI